ncbi:hypothetical protein V1273_003711 [Bradyrhizobium sp. AZCC 1721]
MQVGTKTQKVLVRNSVPRKRPTTNHREIDVRYRNAEKRPPSMARLRCGDLKRLFVHQYGYVLPDDDAGRDDARIMLHHLAMLPGERRRPMASWLRIWAPWMVLEEASRLVDAVLAKPIRWRADTLAKRLGLTAAVRSELGITTIGAIDLLKAEREEARNARSLQRRVKKRRKRGVQPRDEWLAQHSKERTKPWEAEGVSRRTWFRRRKAHGTGLTPSIDGCLYGGARPVPPSNPAADEARVARGPTALSVALTGNALVGLNKRISLNFCEGKGKEASGDRPLHIVGGGA